MTEQTPESESDVTVAPEHAEAEVAADLRNALRGFAARATDSDTAAAQYEESARRERTLAAEYRAKADVLRRHMETLGINADEVPAS